MSKEKQTILQRRAAFLGSALAAISSCSKPIDSNTPHGIAPVSSENRTVETGVPDASLTPKFASICQIPEKEPFQVAATHQKFLKQGLDMLHRWEERLRKAEALMASLTENWSDSPETTWKQWAEHLDSLDHGIYDTLLMCPPKSDDGKKINAYLTPLLECIRERKQKILNEWNVRSLKMDESSKSKWLAMKTSLAMSRPCLSIACQDW
jgi:hypothetical protein